MTPGSDTIAIVGGGIGGSALALFLARAGIEATVYEAEADDALIGGGLQVAPNGMHMLAKLGLDQDLTERGATASGARFRNQYGVELSRVEHQPISRFGQPAVNATRRSLHQVLVGELQRRGVRVEYGKRLTSVENRGERVAGRFEDGTAFEASIVVGADGLHSRVRASLLPGGPAPGYAGLVAAGGFINPNTVDPADLPAPMDLEMIFGRAGFFGYGHANRRGDDFGLMWWSAIPGPEIPRRDLAGLTDDDRRELLLNVHRGWCAPVERIIERSGPMIFVGNIYDIRSLPTWSRGRIVLMGDAAHAVSPHAGQGASLALEDALVLARLIKEHASRPEAAFRAFETARRARAERIVEYGRRSGTQKRKLGRTGAWIRDRFVSLLLPRLVRRSADWMYRPELDPSSSH